MMEETHSSIKTNEQNSKIIFEKLKRDFIHFLQSDQEEGSIGEETENINLKSYIRMMHALGFIHVRNRSSTEEEMLTEIWKNLGGTNENTVKVKNLFLLLAGIMNLQL